MEEKIYMDKGLVGELKIGAKIQYTDELGVEWVKKKDVIWS